MFTCSSTDWRAIESLMVVGKFSGCYKTGSHLTDMNPCQALLMSWDGDWLFIICFHLAILGLFQYSALYTNCLCWPSINWVPGCQTIGESHSGDMETFVAWWITFHTFKGLLRLWWLFTTHTFQLPLWARGGGFRGTHRPTCICSQYLVSLGLAWAERGMGALYIKYTWSIGNCASWCNIPAP